MEPCVRQPDLSFLSAIAILSCVLVWAIWPPPQRQFDEMKRSIQRLENEIARLNIAIADDDESFVASDESSDDDGVPLVQ